MNKAYTPEALVTDDMTIDTGTEIITYGELKQRKSWIDKLEADGILRNELCSLGWAVWLFDENGVNHGYLDETLLRQLADEIEARNKPFWDEYEAYCATVDPNEVIDIPDEWNANQVTVGEIDASSITPNPECSPAFGRSI